MPFWMAAGTRLNITGICLMPQLSQLNRNSLAFFASNQNPHIFHRRKSALLTGQNLFTPYLFYAYILSYYQSWTLPTFSAKAAGFPAAYAYIIFRSLSMYREMVSLSSRQSASFDISPSSSVKASICSSRAASILRLQSSDFPLR